MANHCLPSNYYCNAFPLSAAKFAMAMRSAKIKTVSAQMCKTPTVWPYKDERAVLLTNVYVGGAA